MARDPADNAASVAFAQHTSQLLSAQQLMTIGSAGRRRRVRSLGRFLRGAFSRLYRRGLPTSTQPPPVLEGVVIPTPTETDPSGQTVIVIGIQQQTKGE